MGLDMYLMKTKKTDLLESKTMRVLASDLYEKNEHNAILFEPFEKLGLTYTYTKWEHLGERTYLNRTIAYWRKANAIHKWIYENCASEEQADYEDIEVSKEKLEELVNVCRRVLEDFKTCEKSKTKVQTGWGTGEDAYEEIEVYNSKVADELLPTERGFFFGSLEYNEYYKGYLEYTIERITQVLEETDFDTEELYYSASY